MSGLRCCATVTHRIPFPPTSVGQDEVDPDHRSIVNLIELQIATTSFGEHLGQFCVDPDSAGGKLVFNRTVTLRDTWAKIEQKQKT